MNKLHKKRLIFFSLLIFGLAIAIGMILFSLKQNINVFYTPTDLATKELAVNYHFRLGGMVKVGSVRRYHHPRDTDLSVQFIVTDFKHEITVRYNGVLPDLFREGKGVIVTGALNELNIFNANEVLAKHDENYMPIRRSDDKMMSAQNA